MALQNRCQARMALQKLPVAGSKYVYAHCIVALWGRRLWYTSVPSSAPITRENEERTTAQSNGREASISCFDLR